MIAEVITIGDELLIGQVVNTNASWLGEQLSQIGIPLRYVTMVGDRHDDILSSLTHAWKRAGVVLLTGGLGPTHDDVTKKAVAEFLGARRMVTDENVLQHVKDLFARRGVAMPAVNVEQARVPEGASVLWNDLGTAPGLLFEKEGRRGVVLPGVPAEMKHIFAGPLLPHLREWAGGVIIRHRTIRTHGIGESSLAELLAPISELEQFGKLAFLAGLSGVNVRISATGRTTAEVEHAIRQAEARILAKAGKYVYGFDGETLEEVIGRKLREQKATLAVAESCTGGLIAHRLTNIPGSSEYFERGLVTYSNASKTALLGVPEEVIARHGAVSEECVRAMAEGVRQRSGTHYGLATTGIAGPSGGSPGKPVGLVWAAVASPVKVTARHVIYTSDRLFNKERFSTLALSLLYRVLQETDT
ncbi:MAG: competence/damage-inducible protein A [candidate division KSB1 bacterium]|nr:competence/damage-inducible protein A [candidate division KSB1 bacterium]MDZ7275738.1 competence/damage-inducible protein A [candidate division KSB1 bacterium]MDZ7284571.1 competence/damage-inducible protein A [candidate division KSB1 bacterium]MDZ7298010.1 competence/damage-inducible protein A [candidate division KSB1 bacterium]MDZ7348875.1 competence/damage-inducible protein A [candidate division KSB1 bacterium]